MHNPRQSNPWQRGTTPGKKQWTPVDWEKVMKPQVEPALRATHDERKKVKKNKGKKRQVWFAKRMGWLPADFNDDASTIGGPENINAAASSSQE